VIVAGLGNVSAVLATAVGLGAAENAAAFLFGAEYQIACVYGLLVIILVSRNVSLARQRKYLA